MPSTPRFAAIQTANARKPREIPRPVSDGRPVPISKLFGQRTFNMEVMADKLPRGVFRRLKAAIHDGAPLDRDIADAVAHAVKEWAMENACTHFTHWFQPMTGSTAEKHDAFLTFTGEGQAIERFTADMLIQSEPDASSFPSGGMRSTFEARGYTAWDPSSPIFIMEGPSGRTLCIPSAFVSYTGEALDMKSPLLRSMEAVNQAAQKLLKSCGFEARRVTVTLGCEQEYFLIDRAYWALRPDLAIAGRTVVGAAPPKGQSLEDHYFGAIPSRVLAFMQEVEHELYLLGVPAKTRHNEVAPSQFEIAPIFKEANVAVDHNQITMEVLRRVSQRHDFKVVLHEKPFAGINGSGKHANWSLADSAGENLLEPGKNPSENIRFLAVMASVVLATWRWGGVLRSSVATHGNDFRLGANEAPPAIMSVFLGDLLTRIADTIARGEIHAATPEQVMIELGVSKIPSVAKDNTDRNRTSPMAFTGNKFEFRAVGSQQNPSWPVTVLNTIVADAMVQLATWAEEAGGGRAGALAAIRKALVESAGARFDGNGYSEEWRQEAARRGLKNHAKTPDALAELSADATAALFARHKVLSPAEVGARFNINAENYIRCAEIEADSLRIIVDEMVLPAAFSERAALAEGVGRVLDLQSRGMRIDAGSEEVRLRNVSNRLDNLVAARGALEAAIGAAGHDAGVWARDVRPAMEAIRAEVDALEQLVADHRWPLPKYREMLFLV